MKGSKPPLAPLNALGDICHCLSKQFIFYALRKTPDLLRRASIYGGQEQHGVLELASKIHQKRPKQARRRELLIV